MVRPEKFQNPLAMDAKPGHEERRLLSFGCFSRLYPVRLDEQPVNHPLRPGHRGEGNLHQVPFIAGKGTLHPDFPCLGVELHTRL